MAYENFSSAARTTDELSASQLLMELEHNVKAIAGIDSEGSYGGIRTRDNAPGADAFDDIAQYQPGIDLPHNIDMAKTYASKTIKARKGRADERPRKYHALVEYGSRYMGATGEHTLSALARIALATTCLAADGEGAELSARFVSEESKPLPIDGDNFNPTWTLKRFDDYRKDGAKPSRQHEDHALAAGLTDILSDDDLMPRSDVVLVASDFLSGEERNWRRQLQNFSWERPLRALHHELGDRLFVVRLTTPAQRELPHARRMVHDERILNFDMEDLVSGSLRFRTESLKKAQLISNILRGMRVLELDTTEKHPMVEVPKFMFEAPRSIAE